jgi:hypothetical protein
MHRPRGCVSRSSANVENRKESVLLAKGCEDFVAAAPAGVGKVVKHGLLLKRARGEHEHARLCVARGGALRDRGRQGEIVAKPAAAVGPEHLARRAADDGREGVARAGAVQRHRPDPNGAVKRAGHNEPPAQRRKRRAVGRHRPGLVIPGRDGPGPGPGPGARDRAGAGAGSILCRGAVERLDPLARARGRIELRDERAELDRGRKGPGRAPGTRGHPRMAPTVRRRGAFKHEKDGRGLGPVGALDDARRDRAGQRRAVGGEPSKARGDEHRGAALGVQDSREKDTVPGGVERLAPKVHPARAHAEHRDSAAAGHRGDGDDAAGPGLAHGDSGPVGKPGLGVERKDNPAVVGIISVRVHTGENAAPGKGNVAHKGSRCDQLVGRLGRSGEVEGWIG